MSNIKKVDIDGLAFGGRGIGRIEGKVVFVPFTAPGDKALVRITSEKKGFSEGVIESIETPSPLRQSPACRYFGRCGGCALQHIYYTGQVEWKEKIFEETVLRIGKPGPVAFDSPLSSPKDLFYRARARFQVKGRAWGFFKTGTHEVIEIDDCPVLEPPLISALRSIKPAMADIAFNKGLFAVELGVSEGGGVAAAFHESAAASYPWERLADVAVSSVLKGFEVLSYKKDSRKGKRVFSAGDTTLSYTVSDVRLSAGISVFSQVNRAGNRALIEKVAEYAGISGSERILDIFSGVGNLTLPLAKNAKEAVGVEASVEATRFAEGNALVNSLFNVEFEAADAEKWLDRNIKTLEKKGLDVVILDPSRGGQPEIAKALGYLRPKKIIYVSCSPPTLARDISILKGCGYRVFRAGLLDMFPQTYHIEGIAGLELKA